jgi:tetratricopeptide (TPR) repeat protein
MNSLEMKQKVKKMVNSGQYNQAITIIENHLTSATLHMDEEIELQYLLGDIYYKYEKTTKSLDIANSVVSKSKEHKITTYHLKGQILATRAEIKLGNYEKGLDRLKTITRLLESIGDVQLSTKVEVLVEIALLHGTIHEIKGEMEQALGEYEKGMELIKEIDNNNLKSRIVNAIGVLYAKKGDLEKALGHFESSLAIRKKTEDIVAIGNIMINVGVIYKLQGNLDKALDYYYQALNMIRDVDQKEILANLYNNIGNIHRTKGELKETFEFYNKSLELYQELGDKTRLGLSLLNMGAYFENKGEFEKALEYHQQGLAIHQELGNPQSIAHSYICIGKIYQIQMEYTKAQQFIQQALELYEELENNLDTSLALYAMINTTIGMNNIQQAKACLKRLKELKELENNKFIDQRYLVAKAYVIQSDEEKVESLTFNALHRIIGRFVVAQRILREVISQEMVEYERTVEAIFNLCELLIIELKTLGNELIIQELESLTQRLFEIGEKQNAYALQAKTYLLQGKLELVKPNYEKAKELLEKGYAVTQEKGYERLAKVMKHELEMLEGSAQDWQEESKKPLIERMGKLQLEGLVYSLRQDRVEYFYEKKEMKAPSMRELTNFAKALKKKPIGW